MLFRKSIIIILSSVYSIYPQSSRFAEFREAHPDNYQFVHKLLDSLVHATQTDIKKFHRWNFFWSTRADSTGDMDGGFKYWVHAALNYPSSNSICTTNGNWYNIGPGITSHSLQELGYVSCAAVVPTNTEIIYLGTNCSGLWKTTNSSAQNPNWTNVTDALRYPGLGINDILLDMDNPQIIYIAVGMGGGMHSKPYGGLGVLKSTDGGNTWSILPNLKNQLTFANVAYKLLQVKNNNVKILYAAVDDMLYRSTDDGNNWSKVYTVPPPNPNSNISVFPVSRRIVDLDYDKTNPSIVFLATDNKGRYDNPLLVVSTDGFSPLSNNDTVIYLPTVPSPSIASNTDITEVERISISVSKGCNNCLFYMHNYNNETPRVGKITYTVNNQLIFNYSVISTYTLPDNLFSNWPNNNGYFYDGNGPSYWNMEIDVNDFHQDIIYLAGTTVGLFLNQNLYTISDYLPGQQPSFGGGHADIRFFKIITSYSFQINNSIILEDKVIMCNDGGASINTYTYEINNGNIVNSPTQNINPPVWKNITTQLPITQFYDIDVAQNINDVIIGGTQDNQSYLYYNNLNNNINFWKKFGSGDGGTCSFLNEKNLKYDFIYSNYGGVQPFHAYMNFDIQSLTLTNKFSLIISNPSLLGLNPLVPVNKENNYKIIHQNYISYPNSGLQIYNPQSGSIKNLKLLLATPSQTPNGGTLIGSIDINDTDTQQVIVTFFNPTYSNLCPYRKILISNNIFSTTPTWTDLTQNVCNTLGYYPFAWAPITKVISKPSDPKTFWVTFGAFTTSKVIKTTDGGLTWSDLSNGLPNFPINDIIHEKGSNDGLYVATDVGVFYTNNDIYPSQGWVCFNQGLPVCIVTDLEINYKQNKIYAATFGRGVWKSDLFCPSDYDLSYSSPATNLNQTFKEAQNNIVITATSGLWSVQDFTARAGNEISVSAQPGAEWVLSPLSHLFIHPCNTPGNSFRTNPALNHNQTGSVSSPFSRKNSTENFSPVKLYPNPFDDDITVESDSEWLKYEIYHAHGIKLKEGTLIRSGKIQTASFKPGIYLIRITDNRSSSSVFKMIKQ
jgi:hypothetical protein